MTRICVFPGDRQGCGHYRIIWPAETAVAAGVDVIVRDRVGSLAQRRGADGRLHIHHLTHEPDYDVAVLQRPFVRHVAELVPVLQAAGVAVVVDMDDDAAALPAQHPMWHMLHPRLSPDENWRHAEAACAAADLVTVSTPALVARYGKHGRVRLVRNCVRADWLTVDRRPHDGLLVGWSGAHIVHAGDLDVTRGGIARALPADARFRVAESVAAAAELGIPATQTIVDEWQDLCGPFPEWVADFDIGIAPLAQSRFNEAKSALRGLEYAALGVPFVASPTGEYQQLAREGAGLLAARPRDWTRHISRLAASPQLRADLAGDGHQIAARSTFTARVDQWVDAWMAALDHRHGRVRSAL